MTDSNRVVVFPVQAYHVEQIFFENSLGIMLTCFNNTQVLPKNAVNPKSQGSQKTVAAQVNWY